MRLLSIILMCLLSYTLYSSGNVDNKQIQERIQPIGSVRVKGGEHQSASPAPAPSKGGQAVYEQYCIICHRDGLAGAPKFQNKADWAPRLAGKKIQDILAIAITGLNAMPPKGTCVECSDEELKAAIEYMLPK